MRNDNDRIGEIVEERFKPVDRIDIKMVRRLIQKQNIRIAKKSLRQKDAHLFLIREIRHLLVMLRRLNAETIQQAFRFRLRIPAIHIGKLCFQLRSTHPIGIRKIFFLIKRVLLVHDRDETFMPEHDRTQHLNVVERIVILLEHGETLTRRDVYRAFRRLNVARKNAQKRRLARAVRADDAVTISRRELDAYILEQDALAKLQRQSACTNHKI